MNEIQKNNSIDKETYQTLSTITDELQESKLNIQYAKSVLMFLCDYFKYSDPDYACLISRYHEYSNLCLVTFDIIHREGEKADILLDNLETTLYSLKKYFTSECD